MQVTAVICPKHCGLMYPQVRIIYISNKTKQNKTRVTNEIKNMVKNQLRNAVKSSLTKGGAIAGGAVGAQLGNASAGATLGRALGARISKLIGSGDYAIGELPVHNTLIKGSVPQNISFSSRGVRLAHREYIGDISVHATTVGNFSNNRFIINAADPITFPYLSSIASLFEKYKFHGLVFETISTCSPYIANSAVGSIVSACQFNNAAGIFTNKTQMENCEDAVSARMDHNTLYGVECLGQVQNYYYTRQFGVDPFPDRDISNIYDLGTFQVATNGGLVPANTIVCELWVTYDVELQGPRLPAVRPGFCHMGSLAGCTATNPLGTSRHLARAGTLMGVQADSTTINFNNRNVGDTYYVSCTWFNATAFVAPGVTLTGCAYEAMFGSHSAGIIESRYTVGTQIACLVMTITLKQKDATIKFGTSGTFTGVFDGDVYILPVSFGGVTNT